MSDSQTPHAAQSEPSPGQKEEPSAGEQGSREQRHDEQKPAPGAGEEPPTEELDEPSTEKEPAEAPRAPEKDEPGVDHIAVGIGVIGPTTGSQPQQKGPRSEPPA